MADRTVRIRLEAAVSGFRAGLRQAAADAKSTSQGIQKHVRDNKQAYQDLGVAAAGFGVAAAAGLASVLSSGADFQTSMNQVKAVSGATGAEFDRLSGQARELGAATRFSASEAAEGMGFLAMAGFDATDTLDAMPGVLELAAAGAMDLGTAADIASNVLTGFGLAAGEVGRVNDVMAATFTTTNTDLRQLGEAMKFVAPVAASAGVELEEVAAAIGLMGNAGIQGSMAGTSLRGAITRLLTPSKEAASILERLGINATNADGSLVSLEEIVGQLETSGANTADMMQIFGQRAGPAMAALVSQGSDALRLQTTAALESAGTAAEIAETQMEGLGGALIELKSAGEGLKIALFESGAGDFAEGAVDTITEFVRTLEGLPAPAQAAFMGVSGIAAAAGTLGGAALLAAPRIVATGDAIRALGGFSRVATSPLRGLVRLIGNPYVLAAAAAAAATGFWASKKAEARRRIEELTTAIQADTYELGVNTRAMVVNRLEQEGALEAAQRLGVSLDLVADAAMGDTAAMRDLNVEINRILDAQTDASGSTESLTGEFSQNSAAANDLMGSVAGLSGEVDEAESAARRAGEAMGELLPPGLQADADRLTARAEALGVNLHSASTATFDLGEELGEIPEVAEEVVTTMDRLNEGFEAFAGVNIDAEDAAIRVRQGFRDLTETLKENEGSLSSNTEAGDANREAINRQARDIWREIEARHRQGDSIQDVMSLYGDHIGVLRDVMREAGMSEDAIDSYIETLGLTPEEVRTRVSLNYDQDEVNRIQAEIDALAGTRDVTFRFHTTGGRTVRGLVADANRMAAQANAYSSHSGGPITSGMPTTAGLGPDERLRIMQVGEHVLPRSETQAVATSQPSAAQMLSPAALRPVQLFLDGRQIARSEMFIDALTGQVHSRQRQTAGAGPW